MGVARGEARSFPRTFLPVLLLAINCLIAFSSLVSGWVGVHVLTVCIELTAWVMLAAAELTPNHATTLPFPLNMLPRTFDIDDEWQSRCRELATIVGGIAVFLSLRTLADVEMSNGGPLDHCWR